MIDSEYRDMSHFPTSRCWSPTLAQTLMQYCRNASAYALIRTFVLATVSSKKTLRVLRNGHVKREKLIW